MTDLGSYPILKLVNTNTGHLVTITPLIQERWRSGKHVVLVVVSTNVVVVNKGCRKMSVKERKVLFVLVGEDEKIKGLVIQRLQKLGYVSRDNVFTDINYDKSSQLPIWKKDSPDNVLINVTDLIDPNVKSEQIKKKFTSSFNAVMVVGLNRDTKIPFIKDDELREQIEYGISLSDSSFSSEERLNLFLSRRRKIA